MANRDQVNVGVIGATGYGGAELVRLLLGHPHARLTYVTSETYAGKPISDALPHLRGFTDLTLESYDPARAVEGRDVLFLAWQPGRAMDAAPALLDAGVRLVDLSADFRLKSAALYEATYKRPHASPQLLAEAVYGIPELWGDAMPTARLIACPGCYPTAALFALAPLLAHRLVDPADLIVNAASGVSGAGRSKFELGFHFPEMEGNYRPYNVTAHRHRPEMEQQMALLSGDSTSVVFAPHLAPMVRGILCTAYAKRTRALSVEAAQDLYRDFYADKPFIQVLPYGEYPATKAVTGTNMAHVSVVVDEPTGRVIAMCAIDNVVRGTSGEAVQSMNRMLGFPDTAGLSLPGPYP